METRTARCLRHGLLTSTALAGLGILPAAAGQLPTGYSTSFGSVGFQRSSGTLKINQGSPSAIVSYDSFSIGRHARVDIHQPGASSALLNRVTGTTTSVIAGRLTANGQVYLINPNGIAITKSGVVKVGGGFVASSLDMTDDEFKSGRRHFAGNGGRVSNQGTITIGRGGYAALLGGKVMNGGTIAVPMGTVALGAGAMATLDVSGDGFLQVALPGTAGGKGALITNSGRISGATVMIDAATARAAARNAVNISGPIDSHTISGQSGSIQIGGGDGGAVAISGRLSVASRNATGGSVTITGARIALHHAHIDARGALGGGTVKIGGDLHGGGTLPHAGTVTIDAKSVIRADATKQGAGGSVVVWSDETTHFAGLISAKGGAQGGDGGSAEVSSHGVLGYTGTTNLLATHGKTGTLLLDPYDVVISSGTDSNISTSSSGGTTTYTPSGTSVISNTEIQTQLATANVTITTGALGSPGSDAGNITVAAPVTWSAAHILTLTAANAIAINAPITIAGAGGLALNAATTTIGSGSATSTQPLISFGNGASVSYAVGSGSGIAGQSLSINSTPYTLVYSMTQLGGISSGNNALATSLTAPTIAYSGPVVATLSGTLEGLGNTITGLTISSAADSVGLIGALTPSGTVRDIGIVGGMVNGTVSDFQYQYIGGLIGINYGTVIQTYGSASVSGFSNQARGPVQLIGGLVGDNRGYLTQSYSTAVVGGNIVGGGANQELGGLVGANESSAFIYQSYATGAVLIAADSTDLIAAGGLVGINVGGYSGGRGGQIIQSYATGTVVASANVGGGEGSLGGLVGVNEEGQGGSGGQIIQSYATGAVSASNSAFAPGGLVGANQIASSGSGSATITAGYYDAATTGQPAGQRSDGSIGLTTAQLANATTLAALNGTSTSMVWGNAGNQTTPYLLNNPGPVYLGSDTSATPTVYTAVRSLAGLEAINANPAGNYVLVQNIDASGTTFTTGVIAGGDASNNSPTPFSGTLEGLGYSVRNLTIAGGSNNYVGLIGILTGTVRDIGVSGGIVAGGFEVGGLVGINQGTITRSYATGAVNGGEAGGLVGSNASGTITQSYATGTVSGSYHDGSLVGNNYQGTVNQSYATGVVSGYNTAGGLVGYEGGTITGGYYDATTTGKAAGQQSDGSVGLTTAQLQGTQALPAGITFTLGSAFSGGAAGGEANVYPYLASFFPNGVQAITGTATSGTQVGFYSGGALLGGGKVSAGANGYVYQAVAAGTLPTSGAMVGATNGTGLVYTDAGTVTNNVLALGAITTGVISETTPRTSLGALAGDVAATFGATPLPTSASTATSIIATNAGGFTLDQAVTAGANYSVDATGGPLSVAASLDAAGQTVTLTSAGAILEQSGGTIAAGTLTGSAAGAATFGQNGNAVGNLGAFTATGVSLVDAVNSLGVTGAVSASGTVTLVNTAGTIMQQSGGTIATGMLTGSAAGAATFGQNGNAVGNLGAFTANDLSLVDAVSSLGVTGAVSASGTVTLVNTAGAILESGGTITAGTLTGSAAGAATFSQNINAVGNLGAFTATDVSLVDAAGSLGVTGAVSASATVTLVNTAGAILEQSGGTVAAGMLTGSSKGAATFGQNDNAVGNLGAFTATDVLLVDAVSSLGVTGAVSASGTVTLVNTAGAILEQGGGTITAGTLTGSSAGDATFSLNGNAVGTLGNFSTGGNALSFADTQALTIGGAVWTGTLGLNLTKGALTEGSNGSITAGQLTAVAPGGISLASLSGGAPANSIATLAGLISSSGAITLTDNSRLVNQGAVQAGGGVLIAINSTFTNASGATVQAGNGSSFKIYTQDPGNSAGGLPADSFGGLTGVNYYNDAYNFGSNQFATALPAGNHFVYAYAAALTPVLTGTAGKVYDGTATAPITNLSVAPSGFQNAGGVSDAATLYVASATYDSPNAGARTVTANIAFASNPNNYRLDVLAASPTIGGFIVPRPVALSGTQTYDGTTNVSAANLQVTNLVNGDNVGLGGIGTMSSRNAGTNILLTTNVVLAGLTLDNGNYTLAGGFGAVAVNPASITVTATTNIKTYDGTTSARALPALTFGELKGSDTIILAESYTTSDAGNGLMLTPTAVITDGNGGANYTVSYVGSTSGTIMPRAVSLSGTQVYDGTTNVSASNLMVTDLVAGDNAGLSGTGMMTSRNAGSNALVSANGALTGITLANGNYTLAGGSGMVAVTPEAITVTAVAGSKTYNGTTTSAATPTITTGAIQAGDTATLSESYGAANAGTGLTLTPTAVIADGNGGANYTVSYVGSTSGTITPRAVSLSGTQVYDGTTNVSASNLTVTNLVAGDNAGLSGTGMMTSRNAGSNALVSATGALTGFTLANGNYTLAGGSGMVAVTPEAITVTAVAGSKTYNGTTTSAATPTITTGAIQAGDTATLSENYSAANAGTGLTLTPTAVIADGNGGANYTVSDVGSTSGTITPATLTYVANAASSIYGATPTGLTGTVTGFVNGQTESNAMTGTLAFTTLANGSSNVGSYRITGGGLTANNGNYLFAQALGNATALTVNPATLTVSGSKTYDGTTGFATGQLAVSGAVNGEIVTLTSGTGTTNSADAGSFAGSSLSNLGIQVSGGNGMASNYTLPGTGTLTIGKATITVAGATGVDKTYDGTTALTSGSTGFTTTGVIGNNATVAATSAQYAGAKAGLEVVSVTGLTISGPGAGDYVLSSTNVQGSGTIMPATVVVSANGGRSTYGNVPGNPGLSAIGLQNGQNVGVLTGLSSSFSLADRSHAGSYTLSVQGLLTNDNYRVVGTSDGVFIVDPRALTVTANNQSRHFGQDNPPLTYDIGGMGLANGDTLAGTLTTTALRDSRGGAYQIEQGTLAAGRDYALTYVPGTLVVGPAPIAVRPAPIVSAVGLASTAERAEQQVFGLPGDSLPLALSSMDGNGAVGAQIIDSLTDPRFGQIVICVKDLCAFAAPRPTALLKQSSLETSR